MSCERFTDAITDHALGAPIDRAAAVHLDACPDCRRLFDGHRNLIEGAEHDLEQALAITASADFAPRLSARIRGDEEIGIPSLSTAWWIGAAAAAVLAIGVYVTLPVGREGAMPVPRPEIAAADPSGLPPLQAITPPLAAGAAASTAPPGATAAPRPAGVARRHVAPVGPARTANVTEPEVIVPPTQARAIARLKELVRTGVLAESSLPPPTPMGSAPPELVIAPLLVPDIVVPDVQTITGLEPGAEHERP